jgi:hypothetical protein
MQEKHVYEYAVIRLFPRVDRGECLNVGVVLYCKTLSYLGFRYELNESRVSAFSPEISVTEIKEHLDSFDRICQGIKDSGPIGKQDKASRFRWLTAKRSTIIQPSEIHPGYTTDPEETLEKLFFRMVK